MPTDEQTRDILQPWRSDALRKIACEYRLPYPGFPPILRTHYSGDAADSATFQDWLARMRHCLSDYPDLAQCLGGDAWYTVFDDAELFNCGEEDVYSDVFRVLPELATRYANRTLSDADLDEVMADVEGIVEDPIEDDYEDEICYRSGRMLLVADGEAFETGRLRLAWLDRKGHVVKDAELEPGETGNLAHYVMKGSLQESGFWTEAGTGPRYKTKGEIMAPLLDRVKEKLAEREAE